MNDFVFIDWAFLIALVSFTLLGIMRGVAKEIIETLGWLIAILIVTQTNLSVWLIEFIPFKNHDTFRSIFAIVLSVLMVRVILEFMAQFIQNIFKSLHLSILDQFLGGLFGIGKVLLLTTLFVMIMGLTEFTHLPYWKQSKIMPYFEPAAKILGKTIVVLLPTQLEELNYPDRKKIKETLF